jgi:DtxR family Mn-dependent transcriptional regulator
MERGTEEYLEALYTLTQDEKIARTTDISEYLKIAPASVTEMLKKLASRSYVKYSPYKGATLTEKGFKIAEKMTRRHRLLERFLYDDLKIRKDMVHKQACDMEHSLSDEVERSLCQFLNHPYKCPDDGKIIPACDLQFSSCEECLEKQREGFEEIEKRKEKLVPLKELKEHDVGKVTFIRGTHKILQSLLEMGLTLGTIVRVLRVEPPSGLIEVAVGYSRLMFGEEVASDIFVKVFQDKSGSR